MNTLTAFSKKISEANGHLGKMHESNPDENIKILRERFAKDGYLFLKKLLLKDDVISFREWIFSNLKDTGILKENTEAKYGIANQELEKNLKNGLHISYPRSWNYSFNFCFYQKLVSF